MTKRTLRVALIGSGFMGRAHGNAWRQVAAFMDPPLTPRLSVLCGRSREKAESLARAFGWQEVSTDWRDAVRRDDIDVVDICTPGDTHAAIALAAAAAGKHILCEKPLANDIGEAAAMLDAVQRAGLVHMVCHNYRRAPAVMLARQLIEQGRLGEIRHFRGTYLQDWIVDPEFPLVWRLRRESAGSGALGDLGSHVIDLARFLVDEITSMTGLLETFVRNRPLPGESERTGRVDVDDAALALVRFRGGAIGSIEATRMAPGRRNHNRFEINGSLGSVAFDLERMNELEVFLRDDPEGLQGFRTVQVTDPAHPYLRHWWPPGHIIGYEHTFTHTVYDFIAAIDAGTIPRPSFEDGLRNQQLLAALAGSAESSRWVAVDERG